MNMQEIRSGIFVKRNVSYKNEQKTQYVDKETLEKMLDVITKVYDKNSKPKVKKATLKNFYIEHADKYRETLCYSNSRAEVTDKQNASLSYSYLTQEEKDKIKNDMQNICENIQ